MEADSVSQSRDSAGHDACVHVLQHHEPCTRNASLWQTALHNSSIGAEAIEDECCKKRRS